MPSAAARELEGKVSRVIHDAGALILERTTCGSGHNRVVFARGGEKRVIHFAKTPSDGRGTKNALSDLRRMLKELPERSQEPEEARVEPKPAATVQYRPAAKPSPSRLTEARRKEIAKQYLQCSTIQELCEKFDLKQVQAEMLILSRKGDPARKLRREMNLRKREAAKKKREANKPEQPKQRKAYVRLSRKETAERNRRIYVYTTYGMTFAEAGRMHNLTEERVRQIVRAEEKRDVG